MRKLNLVQLTSWLLAVGAPLLIVCSGTPARAQSGQAAQSIDIPLNEQVVVPCAADGAGEIVDLSGTLHVVTQNSVNPDGTLHVVSHFNPQGVTGVGEVTGDKYQGTGVEQTIDNFTAGATEFTEANNFRIIGPGPGNNFLLHFLIHFTINANGVETATMSTFSIQCR